MAFKRSTFTLTVDATGTAEATNNLSGIPATLARHAFLEAITVDDSAASASLTNLTLYESALDEDGIAYDSAQLCYIEGETLQGTFYPRDVATVDVNGDALTGIVRIPIRQRALHVAVEGGVSGDVYTVQVYYETAGDYRF